MRPNSLDADGVRLQIFEYPDAAREYLRFMLERSQYEAWQQASLGCMTAAARV